MSNFRTMKESPRWLIQRGRISEARRVLGRMLKYNNVSDEVYVKMHNLLDSEYRVIFISYFDIYGFLRNKWTNLTRSTT